MSAIVWLESPVDDKVVLREDIALEEVKGVLEEEVVMGVVVEEVVVELVVVVVEEEDMEVSLEDCVVLEVHCGLTVVVTKETEQTPR